MKEIEGKQLFGRGQSQQRVLFGGGRAGIRQPDWLEMVTPAPPGAMTLPTSSSSTAVP